MSAQDTPDARPRFEDFNSVVVDKDPLIHDCIVVNEGYRTTDGQIHGMVVNFINEDITVTTVEQLGRGGFSNVYKGRSANGQTYALKVSNKELTEAEWKRLREEVAIMQLMARHPNIVHIVAAAKDEKKAYILMERCHYMTLSEVLQKRPLTRGEILWIGHALVSSVAYIHSKGCIHRDLKPSNLLFDFDGNLKVTDFGLSTRTCENQPRKSVVGTAMYMIPEMATQVHRHFSKQRTEVINYGPEVDAWGIGIVLYGMMTGKLPYSDLAAQLKSSGLPAREQQVRLLDAVAKMEWKWPANFYGDTALTSLVEHILARDPKDRATLQQVLSNPIWGERPQMAPPTIMRLLSLLKEIKTPSRGGGGGGAGLGASPAGNSERRGSRGSEYTTPAAHRAKMTESEYFDCNADRIFEAEEDGRATILAAHSDALGIFTFIDAEMIARRDIMDENRLMRQSFANLFRAKLTPTLREVFDRAAYAHGVLAIGVDSAASVHARVSRAVSLATPSSAPSSSAPSRGGAGAGAGLAATPSMMESNLVSSTTASALASLDYMSYAARAGKAANKDRSVSTGMVSREAAGLGDQQEKENTAAQLTSSAVGSIYQRAASRVRQPSLTATETMMVTTKTMHVMITPTNAARRGGSEPMFSGSINVMSGSPISMNNGPTEASNMKMVRAPSTDGQSPNLYLEYKGRASSTKWSLRERVKVPEHVAEMITPQHRCLNNHMMEVHYSVPAKFEGIYCNGGCNKYFAHDTKKSVCLYRCNKCDFDICLSCANAKKEFVGLVDCPTCGKKFVTRAKMNSHKASCRGPSSARPSASPMRAGSSTPVGRRSRKKTSGDGDDPIDLLDTSSPLTHSGRRSVLDNLPPVMTPGGDQQDGGGKRRGGGTQTKTSSSTAAATPNNSFSFENTGTSPDFRLSTNSLFEAANARPTVYEFDDDDNPIPIVVKTFNAGADRKAGGGSARRGRSSNTKGGQGEEDDNDAVEGRMDSKKNVKERVGAAGLQQGVEMTAIVTPRSAASKRPRPQLMEMDDDSIHLAATRRGAGAGTVTAATNNSNTAGASVGGGKRGNNAAAASRSTSRLEVSVAVDDSTATRAYSENKDSVKSSIGGGGAEAEDDSQPPKAARGRRTEAPSSTDNSKKDSKEPSTPAGASHSTAAGASKAKKSVSPLQPSPSSGIPSKGKSRAGESQATRSPTARSISMPAVGEGTISISLQTAEKPSEGQRQPSVARKQRNVQSSSVLNSAVSADDEKRKLEELQRIAKAASVPPASNRSTSPQNLASSSLLGKSAAHGGYSTPSAVALPGLVTHQPRVASLPNNANVMNFGGGPGGASLARAPHQAHQHMPQSAAVVDDDYRPTTLDGTSSLASRTGGPLNPKSPASATGMPPSVINMNDNGHNDSLSSRGFHFTGASPGFVPYPQGGTHMHLSSNVRYDEGRGLYHAQPSVSSPQPGDMASGKHMYPPQHQQYQHAPHYDAARGSYPPHQQHYPQGGGGGQWGQPYANHSAASSSASHYPHHQHHQALTDPRHPSYPHMIPPSPSPYGGPPAPSSSSSSSVGPRTGMGMVMGSANGSVSSSTPSGRRLPAFLNLPQDPNNRQQFLDSFLVGPWVRTFSFARTDPSHLLYYTMQPGRYGCFFAVEEGTGTMIVDINSRMVLVVPRILQRDTLPRLNDNPHVTTFFDDDVYIIPLQQAMAEYKSFIEGIVGYARKILEARANTTVATDTFYSAHIYNSNETSVPPQTKFTYVRRVFPDPSRTLTMFRLSNQRTQIVASAEMEIRWQSDRSNNVGMKYYVFADGRTCPMERDDYGILARIDTVLWNAYRK